MFARSADFITALKTLLRRSDYWQSLTPPPMVVLWLLPVLGISAPLEESSAYCVWGVFHCEEQKAVPGWLQQEEIHELTWQEVGEVGWFRHSFFHQLRANVEDWGFFPSFPSASLSSYIWNLVWVQTTFSLLGSGKKFPSVLPTKIHRSHRYFPPPWKIRVGREGYCQNLRQNK